MPVPPQTALRIALPVPLPRLFDYLPPPGSQPDPDWIGRRVRVRFGRGEREQVGIVVELVPAADDAGLKRAEACLDDAPVLRGELFDSLRWAAAYYHAPLGEVLAAAQRRLSNSSPRSTGSSSRHASARFRPASSAAGTSSTTIPTCSRSPRPKRTRTRRPIQSGSGCDPGGGR